jgi:hypothetical protein
MDGFYKGKGPWWLGRDWMGKGFSSNGIGSNIFQTESGIAYRLGFTFRQVGKIVTINYDPPFSFIRDVMVEENGKWKGKIYLHGVKVGKFELVKEDL